MDDDFLFRAMNEEDPYFMGPRCDDPRRSAHGSSRSCLSCRFCKRQADGSYRCSTSGRRISDGSESCANYCR